MGRSCGVTPAQHGSIRSRLTITAQTGDPPAGEIGQMTAELLERDHELLALDTLLGEVMTGQGRSALIGGEAGIGKTALVERFIARAQARQPSPRLLWGSCEALFAPRPLGPLYDIAQQAPGPLRALLETDANRATL